MPYTDKHTHLEGSVPPSALIKLLHRHRSAIADLPEYFNPYQLEIFSNLLEMFDNSASEAEMSEFLAKKLILQKPVDLQEFIQRLPTKLLKFLLRSPEDLTFAIDETLSQYGPEFGEIELLFRPLALANQWLNDDDILDIISSYWQQSADKQRFRFVLSLRRDQQDISLPYLKKIVGQFGRFADRGISKLDICSDENKISFTQLTEQLDILLTARQQLTIHIGETTARDLPFILEKYPQIKQFNHGIWAAFDPTIVEKIVQQKIELTVCPLSSLFTGSLSEAQILQALRIFKATGINYSICTDDSTIIKGTVYAPYKYLEEVAPELL